MNLSEHILWAHQYQAEGSLRYAWPLFDIGDVVHTIFEQRCVIVQMRLVYTHQGVVSESLPTTDKYRFHGFRSPKLTRQFSETWDQFSIEL
jgi:hypothetical protein